MKSARSFVVLMLMACAAVMTSSCSKKKTIGSPYILYEIHGTVTDMDGKPLQGISVSSGESGSDLTSANGEFEIYGRSAPSEYADVVCEDTDGDSNGGDFMKTTVSVQMKLRSAGSGNNKGNYFASEVVIPMLLKNEGMQDDINPPVPF